MRFSERVSTTVIDWKKNLALIIAGQCSPAREAWLTSRAMNWSTCACGQLDASLPHRLAGTGIPEDGQLVRLGLYFAMLMHERNFKAALDVVRQIHDRSDQLGYPVPEEREEPPPQFIMMDDLPDLPTEQEVFPAYRQPLTVNMHWIREDAAEMRRWDERVAEMERAQRTRLREMFPSMVPVETVIQMATHE